MAAREPDTRIIDGLLEAAVDGAPWPGALVGLAAATRAQVGSMIVVNRQVGHGSGFCIGVDEHWASAFVARESRHVAIGAHFVAPGQVFTDRMAVPRQQFERTSFFNEWARPSGQTEYAGVAVLNAPEDFAFVGLSRGSRRGPFDGDELKRLARLAPHLRRATQIWLKLGAATAMHLPLEAALDRIAHAVLLTDAGGRVRYANRAAGELLMADDGLTAGADGLSAVKASETTVLRGLIAQAAKHSAVEHGHRPLRLQRRSGGAPLTVLVSSLRSNAARPSRAEVLVVVLDPHHPFTARTQQLRLMYGLSPAEAVLACHLTKGIGLKAAARALNIAPTTARTHLKRIFAKTGVRNQVQLAELTAGHLLLRS
jgi:DNA-binding CsgD family transcriptional regulator/PAS domain-containing protein